MNSYFQGVCMRAGGRWGGGGLPFSGWEFLLRKTIAVFRGIVWVNYKAGRLISYRNTFSFREQ